MDTHPLMTLLFKVNEWFRVFVWRNDGSMIHFVENFYLFLFNGNMLASNTYFTLVIYSGAHFKSTAFNHQSVRKYNWRSKAINIYLKIRNYSYYLNLTGCSVLEMHILVNHLWEQAFFILDSHQFHLICFVPGHKEIAQFLIEKGANVNSKNCDGYTPLQFTAYFGMQLIFA